MASLHASHCAAIITLRRKGLEFAGTKMDNLMSDLTRRDFAKGAALATAAGYSKIMGANDRVRMGYIGLGNRGDQVHDAFLETGSNETVAVCDLRDDYMDFAIKKSRATPKKYKE